MTQPDTEQCCVCGSPDVTYHNYREQPFCGPCAGCQCTLNPCVRQTLYGADAQPEPVARHTADTITDTALDQLYADLDRYEETQGEMNEWAIDLTRRVAHLEDLLRIAHETSNTSEAERARAVERAEQAEAAIERVRALAERLCVEPHPIHDHVYPDDIRKDIRAALDEQQEQPAAPVAHTGGNAEDCPACEGTNPPYPFICPGPKDPS